MKNAIEENYWSNPYYRMHYYMVKEIIPDDDKAEEIMKIFSPLLIDRINDYEEIRNLRMKALEGFSPTFYVEGIYTEKAKKWLLTNTNNYVYFDSETHTVKVDVDDMVEAFLKAMETENN